MPDERDRVANRLDLAHMSGGPKGVVDEVLALLDDARAENTRLREAVRALREALESCKEPLRDVFDDEHEFMEHWRVVLAATAWVEETK